MKKLINGLLVIFFILIVWGCNITSKKNNIVLATGDIVVFDYIVSLSGWKIVDTSMRKIAQLQDIYNPNKYYWPLRVKLGSWQILKKIDDFLIGKSYKDVYILKLFPKDGYLRCNPSLKRWFDKDFFSWIDIKVWKKINLNWTIWIVKSIEDKKVLVDFNLPYCDKPLNFQILLRKVIKK